MDDKGKAKDIKLLYDQVEIKLESIADNILTSYIKNMDGVLETVHAVVDGIFVRSAMRLTGDNITKAARLLGINRNTLSKKLKELKPDK